MTVKFDDGTIIVTDEFEAVGLSQQNQNVIYSSGALAVTQGTGLQLNVAAAGAYQVNVRGTLLSSAVAAATPSVGAAHATLPRVDIIVIDTSGVVAVSAGTAAADPEPPALASDEMALAHVYVAAAATSIVTADITDKRQFVSPRPAVMVRKAADESITADNTLSNDAELTFNIPASETWAFEIHLIMSATVNGGFQAAVTVPASATLAVTGMTGDTATVNEAGSSTTSGAAIVAATEAATNGHFWGTVENSTTAGAVTLQWAQNASHADATSVNEGTYLIARKVE